MRNIEKVEILGADTHLKRNSVVKCNFMDREVTAWKGNRTSEQRL